MQIAITVFAAHAQPDLSQDGFLQLIVQPLGEESELCTAELIGELQGRELRERGGHEGDIRVFKPQIAEFKLLQVVKLTQWLDRVESKRRVERAEVPGQRNLQKILESVNSLY